MKTYEEGRDSPCLKCEFMGIRNKEYCPGKTILWAFAESSIIPESMKWICPNCGAIEHSEPLKRMRGGE